MRNCISGKVGHASLGIAKGAAHSFARKLNRDGVLAESQYAYRCESCRQWHLTRRSEWFGTPLILACQAAPESLQRWAMGETS